MFCQASWLGKSGLCHILIPPRQLWSIPRNTREPKTFMP